MIDNFKGTEVQEYDYIGLNQMELFTQSCSRSSIQINATTLSDFCCHADC